MAKKTPIQNTGATPGKGTTGYNPYWQLRDDFARAYAEYDYHNTFSLFVTEGEWEGESTQIQPEWRIGGAGLPQMWEDGLSDFDPWSGFYADEGNTDDAKHARQRFITLAARAGAALPPRVKDAIMPYLLHDLETGNDAPPV